MSRGASSFRLDRAFGELLSTGKGHLLRVTGTVGRVASRERCSSSLRLSPSIPLRVGLAIGSPKYVGFMHRGKSRIVSEAPASCRVRWACFVGPVTCSSAEIALP